eukprot:TRINITY_DN4656_c0_g1_i2.p4 TRINITY_DN4656_c0_g1~~TRINITY_DN4656_c0_g1_i2.p4  ORF type:complete len:131 (-),score=31.73 TRINITY_DN4656_c0_g1_i2:727-1119(-)
MPPRAQAVLAEEILRVGEPPWRMEVQTVLWTCRLRIVVTRQTCCSTWQALLSLRDAQVDTNHDGVIDRHEFDLAVSRGTLSPGRDAAQDSPDEIEEERQAAAAKRAAAAQERVAANAARLAAEQTAFERA